MKTINLLVKIPNQNRLNPTIKINKNKLETTRVTNKQDPRLRLENKKKIEQEDRLTTKEIEL